MNEERKKKIESFEERRKRKFHNTVICPMCGHVNWGNSFYCGRCGVPLIMVEVRMKRLGGGTIPWEEFILKGESDE